MFFKSNKMTLILALILITLTSCNKAKKSENSVITEVQEVPKPVDELMDDLSAVTPNTSANENSSKTIEDNMVSSALFEYFDEQEMFSDNEIKTFVYKLYKKLDGAPGTKIVYGAVSYKEFKINDDSLVLKCDYAYVPFVATYETSGVYSNINYIGGRDDDIDEALYNSLFPDEDLKVIFNISEQDKKSFTDAFATDIKNKFKERTGKKLKQSIPTEID